MATTRRREFPYLWVSWLTKLLAGDQNCEWSTWFRAHYQDYEKQKDDSNLVAWTARHQEMLRNRAEELRREGYKVFVEDQNKFTIVGKTVKLQGKPDIVAVKGDDYVVGRTRHKDRYALEDLHGKSADGGLQRQNHRFRRWHRHSCS